MSDCNCIILPVSLRLQHFLLSKQLSKQETDRQTKSSRLTEQSQLVDKSAAYHFYSGSNEVSLISHYCHVGWGVVMCLLTVFNSTSVLPQLAGNFFRVALDYSYRLSWENEKLSNSDYPVLIRQ